MDSKRAAFIDRDGTLIVDKEYLKEPDSVEFIDGSLEALKILNELGYLVIIISNQSGVARGFFTIDDVERVNRRILEIAGSAGARIDRIYFCPHYEDGVVKEFAIKCECRKPAPGLVYKAKNEFSINLCKSYVIGDKASDIELASKVGANSILVLTGYGKETSKNPAIKPDYIAKNLLDAVRWIKERK